jgi:hypothetical protein
MPIPYPSLLGGWLEGPLLHLTNPRENRFLSTRPLFYRYQSRLTPFDRAELSPSVIFAS